MTSQIYVYGAKCPVEGYLVNKSGGTTVSVLKRGGWAQAWNDAQVLAGWKKLES